MNDLQQATVPYGLEVDGLAMPLLVEHIWSDISQTACDGRELLLRGFEVLGAARSNDLRVRHSPESTSRGLTCQSRR